MGEEKNKILLKVLLKKKKSHIKTVNTFQKLHNSPISELDNAGLEKKVWAKKFVIVNSEVLILKTAQITG